MSRRWWGCVVLAVSLGACRGGVSASDIDRWKRAEHAGELSRAMSSNKTAMPVRILAARALVEIAADSHFRRALSQMSRDDVAAVARALGSDLDRLFASDDLRRQVLAKDFLGLLILADDRHTTERIGPRIVRWITADFQRRSRLGKVSTLQLLQKIGVPALPALHALLKPSGDLLRVAKIIRAIGDLAGLRHAADLLHRAALMQKPQVPGRSLRALFTIGTGRAARRLAELAADPQLSVRSRRLAAEEMRALGHRASRAIAARLALDPKEDLYVRESAILTLEATCDAACAPYLGGLFKTLSERGLRFEAAATILKIGGADELAHLLRRLPSQGIYGRKGVRSLAGDIRKHVGPRALPALRSALAKGKWPAQLVAITALGLVGDASDAKRLEAHQGDGRRPKGWQPGTTLGAEVQRAIRRIRAR